MIYEVAGIYNFWVARLWKFLLKHDSCFVILASRTNTQFSSQEEPIVQVHHLPYRVLFRVSPSLVLEKFPLASKFSCQTH